MVKRSWWLILPLAVAMLVLLAIAGLVGTETGTNWLLQAGIRHSGQTASVEDVNGTIFKGIELTKLRYANETEAVTIGRTVLELNWNALRERVLSIKHLALENVNVQRMDPQPETEKQPFRISSIKIPQAPLTIRLDELRAKNVLITHNGGKQTLQDLSASAVWQDQEIILKSLDVVDKDHRLTMHGTVDARQTEALRLDISLSYVGVVAAEKTTANIRFHGPLLKLLFQGDFSNVISASVAGELMLVDDRIALTLAAEHGALSLGDGNKTIELAPGQLTLNATLQDANMQYRGKLHNTPLGDVAFTTNTEVTYPQDPNPALLGKMNWQIESLAQQPWPRLQGEALAEYQGNQLRITQTTAAPYMTQATINVAQLVSDPQVVINLNWPQIGPLTVQGRTIASENGKLNLAGPVTQLTFDTSFALSIDEHPPVRLSSSGKINEQSLLLESLTVNALDGIVSGTATTRWAPDLELKFDLSANELNLASIGIGESTALGFEANGQLRGKVSDPQNTLSGKITLSSIHGQWHDEQVNGRAELLIQGRAVELKESRFTLGSNWLTAKASLGETVEGTFNLSLPRLSDFDQRFKGALMGNGQFNGTLTSPHVSLALDGTDLDLHHLSTSKMHVYISSNLADLNSPLQLAIDMQQPRFQDFQWQRLNVELAGTPAQHQLQIDLSGEENQLIASATGVLDKKRWQGNVQNFSLQRSPLGDWVTNAPIHIGVSKIGAVDILGGCLTQQSASVCINAKAANTKDGEAMVRISDLPLRLLKPWLPTDSAITGSLSSQVTLNGQAENFHANGSFLVSDGLIETALGDADSRKFTVESLKGAFESSTAKTHFTMTATIPQMLSLDGQGEVAHTANSPLAIDINLDVPDLKWIEQFAPELGASFGRIEGSLNIRGTREAPTGTGRFELVDGSLRLADAGFTLNKMSLNLETTSSHALDLTAILGSVAGDVNITGSIDATAKKELPFTLHVKGENFALARLPDVDLDVNPDLHIEGTTERFRVSGEVVIPKFRLEINELPKSIVTVSQDQILLDESGQPLSTIDSKHNAFLKRVSADVTAILGDNISITGLGVNTSLAGRVRITRDPNLHAATFGIAEGKVTMDGGSFDAYGQRLDITKGAFIFAGPIDNPNIDVRAERAGLPVVAGIEAQGSAKNPKISLFSSPALGDADILSYIMTGRPINAASSSEAQLVTEAAFSFGLEQASVITDGIRDLFGLDQLGLGGNDAESISLTAGKQLTPKLSFRSQLDVFDQIWSFFLRYQLSESWSVEAESGRHQGGDLLYTIEREQLFNN